MIAIGVGPDVSIPQLTQIAGTNVLLASSYYNLQPLVQTIVSLTSTSVECTTNFTSNSCGSTCQGFCKCGSVCQGPTCNDNNPCTSETCSTSINGAGCVYTNISCSPTTLLSTKSTIFTKKSNSTLSSISSSPSSVSTKKNSKSTSEISSSKSNSTTIIIAVILSVVGIFITIGIIGLILFLIKKRKSKENAIELELRNGKEIQYANTQYDLQNEYQGINIEKTEYQPSLYQGKNQDQNFVQKNYDRVDSDQKKNSFIELMKNTKKCQTPKQNIFRKRIFKNFSYLFI